MIGYRILGSWQFFIHKSLDDTKYLQTKFVSLLTPDTQVSTSVEGLCRTLCSGNSSCAVYVYTADDSTCSMSGAGAEVVQTNLRTDPRSVYVKKRLAGKVTIRSVSKNIAPGEY